MGISLIRLVLVFVGITFIALALSLNLAEAISNFLGFAHSPVYPGLLGLPA